MKVILNDKEYFLKWKHNNYTHLETDVVVASSTDCWIEQEDRKIVATATATMHPEDKNYCKNTGRKVSLARLFKNPLFSDKQERTTVWKQYFETCKRKTKFPRSVNAPVEKVGLSISTDFLEAATSVKN